MCFIHHDLAPSGIEHEINILECFSFRPAVGEHEQWPADWIGATTHSPTRTHDAIDADRFDPGIKVRQADIADRTGIIRNHPDNSSI